MTVKQIIIMRSDLRNSKGEKVRTGKLIAQACHASIAPLTRQSEPVKDKAIICECREPTAVNLITYRLVVRRNNKLWDIEIPDFPMPTCHKCGEELLSLYEDQLIEQAVAKELAKEGINYLIDHSIKTSEAVSRWITGDFTKVVLKVNSLRELEEIEQIAIDKGVSCYKITDSGKTEFAEPTVTCLSLGPDFTEKLDFTGHLSLL